MMQVYFVYALYYLNKYLKPLRLFVFTRYTIQYAAQKAEECAVSVCTLVVFLPGQHCTPSLSAFPRRPCSS
jgi:hypothetical protein